MITRPFILRVLGAIAFLISANTLFSAVVTSKDGETLRGKIISESLDSIVFESPFIGIVTIPRSNIATLAEDEELPDQPKEKANQPQSFQVWLDEVDAPFSKKDDDTYDWIQLKSGEWLKGRFKAMYSQSFEFDSDKLNLLEFDWEDIKRIRTRKNLMSVSIRKRLSLAN
ncbi:MAG: hypothetical protein JKY51_03185 [Opitutaceae bacterium]|nr:hypothetical protein [Opitutaceae bacterium]